MGTLLASCNQRKTPVSSLAGRSTVGGVGPGLQSPCCKCGDQGLQGGALAAAGFAETCCTLREQASRRLCCLAWPSRISCVCVGDHGGSRYDLGHRAPALNGLSVRCAPPGGV